MIDPVEFGKQMAAIVREATSPLVERIDALEKELAGIPEPVAPVEIDTAAIAKEAASLIPAPKDGESLSADDVKPLLAEMVDAAIKAIPPAKDGEDGKDADMAELKLCLSDMVKQIQPPAPPTIDEVAAVFERRFSDLTLSWERQARDTFERAADKMPIPENGRDAIPLESFDLSLSEDGRTVTVKMQAGETQTEKSIRIPSVIDRGPYKQGNEYEKGDGVTHGGSFWIAQDDKPEGAPGMGGKGWRLAVKKGRDGRDLRDNASSIDPNKGVSIK